jgi:uncharacterized membrane protein
VKVILHNSILLLMYNMIIIKLSAIIFIMFMQKSISKEPRYRPGCGLEGGRGIAPLFQDFGARRG